MPLNNQIRVLLSAIPALLRRSLGKFDATRRLQAEFIATLCSVFSRWRMDRSFEPPALGHVCFTVRSFCSNARSLEIDAKHSSLQAFWPQWSRRSCHRIRCRCSPWSSHGPRFQSVFVERKGISAGRLLSSELVKRILTPSQLLSRRFHFASRFIPAFRALTFSKTAGCTSSFLGPEAALASSWERQHVQRRSDLDMLSMQKTHDGEKQVCLRPRMNLPAVVDIRVERPYAFFPERFAAARSDPPALTERDGARERSWGDEIGSMIEYAAARSVLLNRDCGRF